MWTEFKASTQTSIGFLSSHANIAFMLCVDWVKPFKRGQYHFGTVYLVVLNLPRSERHLRRWVNVVGIIPGPHEPKMHMNTYLKPLVDDLLLLWHGIDILLDDTQETITVKAMLFCVSCDIPALRKVTQFLSHKANKGCNMCRFEAEREDGLGASGRMSYLSRNFQFDARSNAEVRDQAMEWKNARNKTQAKEIATKNGVRYTELLRLPYYDPVRMCAVDTMHDLLLGLVHKEVSMILNTDKNPSNQPFTPSVANKEKIRERIKSIEMPSDCGRLPTTIMEKNTFDGLTAQQWLNFALVYARPCFYGLISVRAYESLKTLCEIVELCAKYRITVAEVDKLESLVKKHHGLFGRIYGKWNVSINHHMALHLPDTVKRFGPSHAFWCFASERLNGDLTALPSSGRSVEKEVFMRFITEQKLSVKGNFNMLPQGLKVRLNEGCPALGRMVQKAIEEEEHGKHADYCQIVRLRTEAFISAPGKQLNDAFERQCNIEMHESEFPFVKAKLQPPIREDIHMDDELLNEVKTYLTRSYGNRLHYLSEEFTKFARCNVNGINFSSAMNRSERSSFAKAFCATNDSEVPRAYYGKVSFFFVVNVLVACKEDGNEERREVPLAYIKWYTPETGHRIVGERSGLQQVKTSFYKEDNVVSVYRLIKRVVPCKIGNYLLISELPC